MTACSSEPSRNAASTPPADAALAVAAADSPPVANPPATGDPEEIAAAAAAADAAASAAAEAAGSASHQFTKAEFDRHVFGKTKAEIRTEFGAPLTVHDADDEWFYPSLAVYDADAGIQVAVTVRFVGIEGPNDTVAGVRF